MATLTRKRTGSFAALVEEYRNVRDTVGAFESNSWKLTPKAYLAEALKVASITRDQAGSLRRMLDASPTQFPATLLFIHRVRNAIRSGNMRRPAGMGHPIYRTTFAGEPCQNELQAVGLHFGAALCVAVLLESEQRPESFGDVEDYAAHEQRYQETKRQHDMLAEQIRERYGEDGVELVNVDKQGRGEVRLKHFNVLAHPLDSLPDRLASA